MPKPENKVKFGLTNVHYAKLTFGEDGAASYAAPKRILGGVSLSLDPQGDAAEFYADNILFYATAANTGYQGPLELARISQSFREDILGDVKDPATGVLYENAAAEPAHFALLFQFDGDVHAVRHVLYDCTVARPSVKSETTTKSKTPSTDTLQMTSVPRSDGIVKGSTTGETPAEIYNGWFTAVVEPPADLLTPAAPAVEV